MRTEIKNLVISQLFLLLIYLKKLFATHEVPTEIISDNYHFFHGILKNVVRSGNLMSSPYYVLNQTVEQKQE